MSYELVNNVPIPDANWRQGNESYPFGKMEVGDSFATKNGRNGYTRATKQMRKHATRHNVKFAGRWLGDTGRIWRIK